jgi:hypothetical protein
MSKVVLIPKGKLEKLPEVMRSFGLERFSGKEVLVKLHMGERGNKWYVKPGYVKIVADELKKIKAKPFLFDTAVIYRGGRDSKEKYMEVVKEHGFDKIGYEVVIGDEGKPVRMSESGIEFTYEVAKELYKTKYTIAMSHAKGHILTGFGGAIKNFGMGGVSKKAKLDMHSASVKKKILSLGRSKISFNEILSLGAKACLNKKDVIYINFLMDITKNCDCDSNALPIICEDIGILVSNDPVAIDIASVDLIEGRMGKTFKEVTGMDARTHIRFAEEIGMGSAKYELIKVK